MPAKPQSGRAIELGLALRIVSKRGRQVMFGQTGLLFANRQWGIVSVATGNEQGTHNASRVLPLTASEFLQGVATYDYPSSESIPTAAISCDATTVHIGAQLLPGYTNDPVNIRWFGIFK